MEVFWAAPPIARTIGASAFIFSLSVFYGPIPFPSVCWQTGYLYSIPPQLWRLVTPFVLTGGGLPIIITPYMLYTFAHRLEMNTPRYARKGDFFTYLLFIMLVVNLTAGVFLNGYIFTGALQVAMAYTAAQENPEDPTSFFFFTVPAKFSPLLMIVVSFLLSGPEAAMIDATGILAGHAYEFFTRIWPRYGGGRTNVPTPAIVARAFGDNDRAPKARDYGTAFAPRAATSGHEPGWGSRGPGRRLG